MDEFVLSSFLVTWLAASVRLAGPLLLTALGELFAERSGVLNIGIEGTVLLGALVAYLVAQAFGSPWMGLGAALLAGVAVNLGLAWMYVTVGANQVVVGIVFNVLALGVASYGYRLAMGPAANPEPIVMFENLDVHWLSDLPWLGPILFSHTILLYLTLAAVLLAHLVLFRTHFGLGLRAAGEHPPAAENAGISVQRMRYIGVLLSGLGAGCCRCVSGAFPDWPVSRHHGGGTRLHGTGHRHFWTLAATVGVGGCFVVWRSNRAATVAATVRV